MEKSTVDEIRQRFDNDVERFSNIETAQAATMDAPLVLDLICRAAAAVTPAATSVLDVGCGAGNYTIKLLGILPRLECTLVDLSQPMLDRAVQRVTAAGAGGIIARQGDIREIPLAEGSFDIILAAAVLHHLRTDAEWTDVFAMFFKALKPGGSLWISDLTEQSTPQIQKLIWAEYGDYLVGLKDVKYRDQVLSYVEKEDTPRPLVYQLELLRSSGFAQIELLHKNGPFAAFGAVKG
jgi:tRNA (cmo5U34)-methyltransferase